MACEIHENSLIPQLAPELIFHTSQFLRDDTRTLRSASLSSRIWRMACRPLLFHSITLDGANLKYLDKNDTIRPFEELLDSNPGISHLIKVVKARLLQGPGDRGVSCDPWFNDLPRVIQQRLPNTHTFEVIGLGYFRGQAAEDFFASLSLVTSLRRLSLIRCCISNEILNGFVTNIPGLEDVHIHNQWMDGIHTTHPFDLSHIPSPPSMPALELKSFSYHNDDRSGPNSVAFSDWISPIKTLTSLRVHTNAKGSIQRIGQLLQQLVGSLQHLELNFPGPTASFPMGSTMVDDLSDTTWIDLSSNENLRSLHLHPLNHPIVELLLRQASSLLIEKIIITDSTGSLIDCVKNNKTTIDDILTSGFRHLSEVCLVYRGVANREQIAARVGGVFPKLTARGILYVVQSRTETDFCCVR